MNPPSAELAKKFCPAKDTRVKVAYSGKQALTVLEQEPFDILFTDLKMADMGGMELLETMRTRFPDTIPVVITGYATISSAVETMKLGAFDYLPKPFTPDEMAAVAKKAWERKAESGRDPRHHARGDAPLVLRHCREKPENTGNIPDDPQSRAHIEHRVDRGRDRNRQGTGRARASTHSARETNTASAPLIAGLYPLNSWKANCSATSRAHSPVRSQTKKEYLKPQTRGRFSWTKSAT